MPASQDLEAALARSLREVGQLQPIITGVDGAVIDGNLRLRACQAAGVDPWVVKRPDLGRAARADTFIRRAPSVIELAEIVAAVYTDVAPDGARRAPRSGRVQDAVAAALHERYGISLSSRSTAYALQLARLDAGAQASIDTAQPASMKEAIRIAEAHQLNDAFGDPQIYPDRVQHLKRAHEFKAVCTKLPAAALTAADIALYDDLIGTLQRRKAEWLSHAPA